MNFLLSFGKRFVCSTSHYTRVQFWGYDRRQAPNEPCRYRYEIRKDQDPTTLDRRLHPKGKQSQLGSSQTGVVTSVRFGAGRGAKYVPRPVPPHSERGPALFFRCPFFPVYRPEPRHFTIHRTILVGLDVRAANRDPGRFLGPLIRSRYTSSAVLEAPVS